MNDFKVMLNKQQQQYLARLLPKGYSFELYKVRKNISNYPYKEFDKKYKKNEAIILNKKESFVIDSIEPSEKSYRERSEPILVKEQFKKIQQDLIGLTRKLRKHESSYPFRSPVDPKALQIPDYFDVILEPIDLKTIEDKIRRDQYEHVGQFQRDIYKMIMNSYKYNQKASSTEKKTIQFQQFFVQTMKQFRGSKTISENGDKQLVKEEMIDQRQEQEVVKKVSEQKKQQVVRQPTSSGNPFVAAAKTIKQEPKQNSQLFKVLTQMANERPRHSKKQIHKSSSVSNIPKSKSPKKIEAKVKKQQPEDDFSQASLPINELIFSQQIEPTQQKDFESQQQIKEEMKSYLDNETQNNRQQNFSQGYNEAALGGRIKNIQVQKQITNLIKRLSEFPLTKQKKIKNLSKFTNLQQNMTQTDKKKLFDKIIKLDQNDIQYVVRILTKGKCDTSKLEEFQIDLDKADSKVLREVQNFIALRDQSFASSNPLEVNGSMPLSFQPQPIPVQVPKIPKKTKKQQKKIIKKKMSRKNSNDDSFSLNPPPKKKKKSQKPHRKSLKSDQKSELNGNDQQSLNDDKQESSSYHPQPLHHQHHGKVNGSHLHQKSQQIEKVNNVSQKSSTQNKKKPSIESQKQKTPRLQYPIVQVNHVSPHTFHNEDKFDDIDQFLAISQDIPYSNSYNRLRPTNSIEQLDFMDLHFGLSNENGKDYPDEQMKDFSIYQPQKDQNDEDHFF